MTQSSKSLIYEQIQPRTLGNSQKGQDTLISYTFDSVVGTTNKYYVEFGACDGYSMSNTSYLRQQKNWTGLLLEGNNSYQENPDINLHRRFLTKDNICDIFTFSFNISLVRLSSSYILPWYNEEPLDCNICVSI